MNHRLLELFRDFRQRSRSGETDQSLLEFIVERDPYVFSHHPACDRFRGHVWKFKGLYVCKGCLMTFAGMVAGALVYVSTGWLASMDVTGVAVVFSLLLIPSVIAHGLDLPRPLKHGSRFLLGVLVVSALIMLFVTDSWTVRLIIVGTYFAVKIPLARRRERMNRALADGGDP